MSKTPKPAEATKPDTLPFEEALGRLETIVEAMETGDLPLESLLAKYEEGMKLAAVCQEKLAEAEVKVQRLEKDTAGRFNLKPLSDEQPLQA